MMDAQTALWALPSKLDGIWWIVCAVFALPSALMILIKMIVNEPFNLLTISRAIIAASLFFFGMTPLNSGFLPWAALLSCVGGFMTSTLIATGWCNRKDQNETVSQALWRWACGRVHPQGIRAPQGRGGLSAAGRALLRLRFVVAAFHLRPGRPRLRDSHL